MPDADAFGGSGVASSAAPTPKAYDRVASTLAAMSYRGVQDDSDDDDLGKEELPYMGDDITFSNISLSTLGTDLAIDRRKSSVLQRMNAEPEADRGRRRHTMAVRPEADDTENMPVGFNRSPENALPPKVPGSAIKLVEKMAALDIASAKSVAASPKPSAVPVEDPVTPRSATVETPTLTVQATPGIPISGVIPAEHSYTFRAVSRSRSRSRSTTRAKSPNTTQLRRSPRHARPDPLAPPPRELDETSSDALSPEDIPTTPSARFNRSSPVPPVEPEAPVEPAEAPVKEEEPVQQEAPTQQEVLVVKEAEVESEAEIETKDVLADLEAPGNISIVLSVSEAGIDAEDAEMLVAEEPFVDASDSFALSTSQSQEFLSTSQSHESLAVDELDVATKMQTPNRRIDGPFKARVLSEFDPFVPQDYLIAFDSPAGGSSQPVPTLPATKPAPVNYSLMDMLGGDMGTPNSVSRFSQKDVDGLKTTLAASHEKMIAELKASHEEDMQTLRAEFEAKIVILQAELKKSNEMVDGYAETVEKFIQTKEQLVEDNKKKLAAAQEEYQEQLLKIEKEGKDERIQIKAEYLAREEDFQASEKSSKLKIAQLETANVALQTKYDRLKKHAEEKLDGANVEIARVKQALEKDLLTMKTKLTKVETQLKSTQASLENKITENADLTKVCDDLLAQLEGAP